MTRAPVVVFAYSRPLHLRAALAALAQARGAADTELWVFADGPRRPEVEPQVAEVRALLRELQTWNAFRHVHVVESDANLGLARSVIGGVSRVLETHERVIVLEDDLVVAVDFLDFMNDALEYYRHDMRVGSITGSCPITRLPNDYRHSVALLPRSCSHGWATWTDRWSKVDWSGNGLAALQRDRSLRRAFNRTGSDRYGRLHHQMAGRIDSWSVRFGLWQFLAGMYTIYPTQNRVRNIGFDGTGIHCGVGSVKNEEISTQPRSYTLETVAEDPRISAEFHRTYSGAWHRRVGRWVRECAMDVRFAWQGR
jgi:hypothetical protein